MGWDPNKAIDIGRWSVRQVLLCIYIYIYIYTVIYIWAFDWEQIEVIGIQEWSICGGCRLQSINCTSEDIHLQMCIVVPARLHKLYIDVQ